jgi:hypothetical protein
VGIGIVVVSLLIVVLGGRSRSTTRTDVRETPSGQERTEQQDDWRTPQRLGVCAGYRRRRTPVTPLDRADADCVIHRERDAVMIAGSWPQGNDIGER